MSPSKHDALVQIPLYAICTSEKSSNGMHDWKIQPADGPISSGTCDYCKDVREFKNYVGKDASWGHFRLGGDSDGNTASGDGDGGEVATDDPDLDGETPDC